MWRDELKDSIKSIDEIEDELQLGPRQLTSIEAVIERFPIAIPQYYWNLVDLSDPRDPIRRQVIPSPSELWTVTGEHIDPLKEDAFSPVDGLIHKYKNRVLILMTPRCAVHCRFCFRKHFKSSVGENHLTHVQIEKIIKYIQKRKTIKEIILSGGDPLVLEDEILADFIDRIQHIAHLEILRIHTRIPVVLPSRITDELLELFTSHLTCWIVTHFNHPRELTQEAIAACSRIIGHGIPLLNQTVLLKGINDDVKTLLELNQSLIRNRIKPYYLHILDPAPGTSHFRVCINEAVHLVNALSGHLSGYAVPVLVQDRPGLSNKYRFA